jgi:thymidine phosphorylase
MNDTSSQHSLLRLRRLGIDTHREPVIYMRRDCRVCRSEGFEAQARILVQADERSILATLDGECLAHGEACRSTARKPSYDDA